MKQKLSRFSLFHCVWPAIFLVPNLGHTWLAAMAATERFATERFAAQKSPVIDEWYLPTEDEDVPFLYVYEIGQGDPVVVLHGGPGIGHDYMTDIAEGLDNRFQFVFYDQRGASLSYCYSKPAITMDKNVSDLEKLRKALRAERINLISHSAGTYVAMSYLQAYPRNVKNLVLIGATDPKNGDSKFFTNDERAGFRLQAEEAKRFSERPQVQAEIEKAGLNKPNLSPKEESLVRRIRAAGGSIYHIERWRLFRFFFVNRDAAEGARNGMSFVYDWSKILAAHPYPVTVINGEYDYQVGRKGSPIWKRVVATEARNVKLVLIDEAGHNCWIDDPTTFRAALRDALERK